jgi:hypothetical protein
VINPTEQTCRRLGQEDLTAVPGGHHSCGVLSKRKQRKVADIRAYLIAEISRAMSHSDAVRETDPDRLAEIAVDTMIESTRKIRFRPS